MDKQLVMARFASGVLLLGMTGASGENAETLAVVGRPVQNLQGQRLGWVEGVLVTPNGQVSALVLATGGLLGIGTDRYQIPWSRVHWQRDGEYLTLDVGRQQVEAEFSAFEPD